MAPEIYIDIFRDLVKAYNNGRLKEKYQEYMEHSESEKIKKYVFAAMGLDYDPTASYEDVKKAMDMRKMKGKIVVKVGKCGLRCINKEDLADCQGACPFGAVDDSDDKVEKIMLEDKCEDCGKCVESCKLGNLVDKIEYMPIAEHINNGEDVYAIVAPAYIGQFGENVTPGKLRTALKALGFKDMIEVALFADILTVKEAIEFDRNISRESDFLITSCCCPMWVAMIKRLYGELVTHVPPSVSPMVACGRTIKKIHDDARVVFIGPCVAKKAEAKEKDISDAVDFVLTFGEIKEIFEALDVRPEEMCEDGGEQASRAGRIYAHTGGVSRAVYDTVNKLSPHRDIKVKAIQGNGVKECKQILQDLKEGRIDANFIEGMGCVGGCVGGPKSILGNEEGRKRVAEYGDSTDMITPLDNPVVYSTLEEVGIRDLYELVKGDKGNIYERDF